MSWDDGEDDERAGILDRAGPAPAGAVAGPPRWFYAGALAQLLAALLVLARLGRQPPGLAPR